MRPALSAGLEHPWRRIRRAGAVPRKSLPNRPGRHGPSPSSWRSAAAAGSVAVAGSLRDLAASLGREEVMAAPVGVERTEQAMPGDHLAQPLEASVGSLRDHLEG